MSQINTSRIENQDTSLGAASILTISPLNASSVAQETIRANKTGVTTTGNVSSGSAGVVAANLVTCLAGVTVAKNITHASAPTQSYHLCNKTYVDGWNTYQWLNGIVGTGSATANPFVYAVNGTTVAMIIGQYHDKWNGARQNLVATLKNSVGTVLQTIVLANVNEGGNTDVCDYWFRLSFAISIPPTCTEISFQCTTLDDIIISQIIYRQSRA